MKSEKNYFTIFGLPISFEVDSATLTQRYRELQKVVHPDNFTGSVGQEKIISVQQAALINDAYNVLKNPMLRAKYLLSLNGISVDDDFNQVMDSAFLMQQMEFRELLQASRNDVSTLEDLIDQFQENYNAYIKEIRDILIESFPAYSKVAQNVRKMQFFMRLIEEADALIVTAENKQ